MAAFRPRSEFGAAKHNAIWLTCRESVLPISAKPELWLPGQKTHIMSPIIMSVVHCLISRQTLLLPTVFSRSKEFPYPLVNQRQEVPIVPLSLGEQHLSSHKRDPLSRHVPTDPPFPSHEVNGVPLSKEEGLTARPR